LKETDPNEQVQQQWYVHWRQTQSVDNISRL